MKPPIPLAGQDPWDNSDGDGGRRWADVQGPGMNRSQDELNWGALLAIALVLGWVTFLVSIALRMSSAQ